MAAADYEGRAQESYVPQRDAPRFNLIGTFPSTHEADRAVMALHEAGFSNADLHVLGSLDDAPVPGDGLTPRDEKLVGRTFFWGMGGVIAGMVLGAVIGLIIMAIPAFQTAIGVKVTAVSFLLAAFFGAIVGSMLGFGAGVLAVDRRRVSNAPGNDSARGPLLIGVRAVDDEHRRAATGALRAAGAASVEWRGGGGHTSMA